MSLYVKNVRLRGLLQLKNFMKHFILFGIFFVFFSSVSAVEKQKIIFDIYRTNQITVAEVEKKFGPKIEEMTRLLELSVTGKGNKNTGEKINQIIQEVTSAIHSMGDFEYVKIRPFAYTGMGAHVTIDIVDKKDKQRMPSFAQAPTQSFPDPEHLIQKWKDYTDAGFSIAFKERRAFKPGICPVHHCVFGFNEKELKPYKTIFNTLVPKNKQKLIEILKKDKDEEKRGIAVFLLAHLKNGDEVVRILAPSISDSSLLVRNDVLRVFGAMLEQGKVKVDLPIEKMTTAMDSPFTEERNKVLYVISGMVNNPNHADYVRKKSSQTLIALLKLQQPNQHGYAYETLKKISGKNFGERDYKAWEQWVKTVEKTDKD